MHDCTLTTDYADIETSAQELGLAVMGALHEGDTTLVLLGPGRDFWSVFRQAPECLDGGAHPIDRWSERIVGGLARQFEAQPLFPFGGPPYQPFLRWALASGRTWSSPVGMLVHDTAGLMVSYRGALRLSGRLALPSPPSAPPCATCEDRPCTTACPAGALADEQRYDTEACHDFLDSSAGQDCMTRGCRARRACPVSQRWPREASQSALHMRAFHPA